MSGADREPFLSQCEDQILACAAPFSALDDTARAGLQNFLHQEVELNGVSQSRVAHCLGDEALKADCCGRLSFVGAHAARAGLGRQERCRRRPTSFDLTFDDLEEAEGIVSTASASGLCESP